MRQFVLFGVLAGLILAGCGPAEPEGAVVGVSQAEAEAIAEEHIREFDRAINAGDADALAELHLEDGARFPPNRPPQMGREAIRAGFQALVDRYSFEVKNEVTEVIVAGELICARGRWQAVRTPKAGEVEKDGGTWIEIKRQDADGTWKAFRTMFVSELPLPEQTAAEE